MAVRLLRVFPAPSLSWRRCVSSHFPSHALRRARPPSPVRAPHRRAPTPPPAQFFIFIARVIGSARATGPFAELEAVSIDSFARLAERACTKFKRWGVDADEVELFAVTKAGKAPTSAEIEAALLLEPLSPFDTLADAGIVSGSCVLARVPPLPAPGAL